MKTKSSRVGAVATVMIAAALLTGCGGDNPEALVASAKESLIKNDGNTAVIHLKNALQKNPDLGEARFLLGKALLEIGDNAAAEKELRKAAELKYPSDKVVPLLARTLVSRGDYKKAIDEFAKGDVTSPESKAELQTSLGQAWMATGDLEAARGAFAAALTAQPGYPQALLGEAVLKARSGDLPGAMALVDSALDKSPTLIEGWQLKGDIASAQGQPDEALSAYRKALEARSSFLPAHAAIVGLLIRQGKPEEAGKQLEAMKKIAPKHLQTFYLQALLAYQERRYASARESVQKLLQIAPDNILGLVLSGNIEFQLGSYAQAETSLLKVLQRVPKQRLARLTLVNTYLRGGQPAKALDALRPLLDEGDTDSDTLALAGEVYVHNGDIAEAGRLFEKAAALDPKSTSKRTALAISHIAAGEKEQGIRELEEIAVVDTGTRADLALIMVNIQQRKFDAALAAVAALEKKQPDRAQPHNLRGAVLMAKGDRAGARISFERASALNPADFAAAASLAKLDLADKKPADARKRFETVLAKDPKNVWALLAIADLRRQEGGTPDEVATLIEKAVAADPTNTAGRLALIDHYLRNKEPKKAAAAAGDALAAFPDRPDILYAAGQAQSMAGDTHQAIATYNRLAQLRPGSPMPFIKEAQAQLAANDYEAALRSLRNALAIKPDLVEAQRAVIAVHLKMDRRKEALAVAREIQKQRPKEPVGYALEGDIFASTKSWNDAAAAYRNGLKQTGATDLAVRLDVALRAGGGDVEAGKFAATWLRDHPKDHAFRGHVAETALIKKDFAGAAREYKLILEYQPNNVLALNNLAWVSAQLKDPKALEYAERAAKLAPNSPAILDTFGVLLVEKGDTRRGIELLQQAVSLAPNAANVRLNLARALVKDKQKDAAKKELETLAKLGDKFAGQAEVAKLMKEL